jgi:hypothetical protein
VDERTRLFLWVLLASTFFAFLGGLFGAVTGVVTWRDGRAAGTVLGLRVARAFARLAERDLGATTRGALVGGTDGAAFGAVVGALLGFIATRGGQGEWESLRPILIGSLALVSGALLFGIAAIGLTSAGIRVLLGLFAGSMCGALAGFSLGGTDGLLFGTLAGAVAGTLCCLRR